MVGKNDDGLGDATGSAVGSPGTILVGKLDRVGEAVVAKVDGIAVGRIEAERVGTAVEETEGAELAATE